ncbi:MAG: HYR domain-containing protein [Acidobacteriota bacterium]
MGTLSCRAVRIFCAACAFSFPVLFAVEARAQRVNLLPNGSVEDGSFAGGPFGWTRQVFDPSGSLTWDQSVAHDGSHSVKITATRPNDAAWIQTISLQPDTNYLLSGWIKSEDVQHTSEIVDAGANLCLYGTFDHTTAVTGTADWTEVRMTFNSGPTGSVAIGARLGYSAGTTTGTAWFDDLRVTEILPTDPHPRWKVLVLVYDTTDFNYVDNATTRHVLGRIDQPQTAAAAAATTRFVLTDIPLLTSGNMRPDVTVRYPGTLARLSPNGGGWWPSPADTAPDRDPAFDSVIVIWQPTVTDQNTGESLWIGSAAGLTPSMGLSQTYATLIIEAATLYGHLNVFKHEWGHSILSYFDATRTAPTPTVSNHAESTTYVNCQTGQYYAWVDETDTNLIPNSIYHNDSGFTHDYYSGTTALSTNPTRCLGITAAAWTTDGPVSKSVIDLDTPPGSDPTPPTTTASVTPPANPAGWHSAEVTVGLVAVDGGAGSGVKQITYSIAGAQSVPVTTVAGETVPVPIVLPGVSTITFFATDNAGNVEPAHVVTVKLDLNPPALTSTRTPLPNGYGWNNTPVSIALHCTDALSGVDGPSTTTTTVTAEGTDQTIEGRCSDLAGLSTTLAVHGISIDRTPPALAAAASQVVRQTSGAGAAVTFAFPDALETGSGVSARSCVPASGSTFPIGVTTVTCTATDLADNTGSTQFTVTVTPTLPPSARMSGTGFIVRGKTDHRFVFWVAQTGHRSNGRFEYWADLRPRCSSDGDLRLRGRGGNHHCDDERQHHPTDHFEATSISSVEFSGDPQLRSNGRPEKAVHSVSFKGSGSWNGRRGYRFEVSAVDGGESRRTPDTFSMVIQDPLRRVVARVTGTLDGGTIDFDPPGCGSTAACAD